MISQELLAVNDWPTDITAVVPWIYQQSLCCILIRPFDFLDHTEMHLLVERADPLPSHTVKTIC